MVDWEQSLKTRNHIDAFFETFLGITFTFCSLFMNVGISTIQGQFMSKFLLPWPNFLGVSAFQRYWRETGSINVLNGSKGVRTGSNGVQTGSNDVHCSHCWSRFTCAWNPLSYSLCLFITTYNKKNIMESKNVEISSHCVL